MIKELPIKEGDKYGFLTLTGERKSINKKRCVECICECGKKEFFIFQHLKSGNTKSCGCKKKELNKQASTKHGFTSKEGKHPLYGCWIDMKQRCYNENGTQYEDYGGRGIIVCDEWKDNFPAFCKWALENGWKKGLTIDRIENDDIYKPSNCRWADRPTQARNTSRNTNLTIFGETKCLQDWSSDSRCVVGRDTLRARIFVSKWSPEKAILTHPVSHTERRNYKLQKCA